MVPTMGTTINGFLPFLSDQGPKNRDTMMAGMANNIDWYMDTVATSFCTSVWMLLLELRLAQISAEKLRSTRHALSMMRFYTDKKNMEQLMKQTCTSETSFSAE